MKPQETQIIWENIDFLKKCPDVCNLKTTGFPPNCAVEFYVNGRFFNRTIDENAAVCSTEVHIPGDKLKIPGIIQKAIDMATLENDTFLGKRYGLEKRKR
jgi:hypothetical protein